MNKNRYFPLLLSMAAMLFLDFAWVETARAIPAWARKYDQDCSMCHYPAVPRLNTLGHKFRQAGYRMPDEFNQDVHPENVSHYLSARGRGRYSYTNPEEGSSANEFQWHDTTLFYSGPVDRNFSGFAELEWEGKDEIGLVAQILGILGQPEHFTTVRIGQFHTLSRVGFGGFDRPTGISTPNIRNDELTSDVKFKLGSDQRGVELAHVFQLPVLPERSRVIAQVTNGVNDEGDGTEGEIDAQKDYTLVFEQILDDVASGFTLLYYTGTYHSSPDLSPGTRFGFQRYGGSFAWILPAGFELQGGYIRSADDPKVSGSDKTNGHAFYVEVEQYFAPFEITTLARYEMTDPDDDSDDDRVSRIIVGLVRPIQEYLRLAVEGTAVTKEAPSPAEDTTDYGAVAEAMLNF